jgi:hypothetical protein
MRKGTTTSGATANREQLLDVSSAMGGVTPIGPAPSRQGGAPDQAAQLAETIQPRGGTMTEEPEQSAVLVVLTEAVPGKEEEFHRWYDTEHIPCMLKLDGFISASRYQLSSRALPGEPSGGPRFLAIYEVLPGKVDEAAGALEAAWGDLAALVPREAMDRSAATSHRFYEPLSAFRRAPDIT